MLRLIWRQGVCVLLLAYAVPAVSERAEASNDASPAGSTTITLRGQTVNPILANAAVEITAAGNATATGTTDASGTYSIDFACSDPDGLITIRVTGTGAQDHIGAARVVHSCAHVTANANAQQEFPVGPISPISTGLYAIVAWTLNDYEAIAPPWSEPVLAPYRSALEAVNTFQPILALAFLNAEGVALPVGASTSLDVALDRTLLQQVNQAINASAAPEDFDGLLDPIFRNPALYRVIEPPNATVQLATYCVELILGCAGAFTVDASETGQYFLGTAGGPAEFIFLDREDIVFQARFESGPGSLRAIRAQRPDGDPLFSFVGIVVIDGQQVEQVVNTVWREVRLANASEYLTLIGLSERTVINYPNNPEIPDRVLETRRPALYAGYSGTAGLPDWVAPADGDQWILEFNTTPALPELQTSNFRADRVTFSAGGNASLERLGVTMQWSISNGELVLEGGGLPTHRYRIVSGPWSRDYRAMVLRVFEAGEAIGVDDAAGLPDPGSTPFVEANVPGRYFSVGFSRLLPSGFGFQDPSGTFTIVLEPGGTGWTASLDDPTDPEPTNSAPLTWEINARGEIAIERNFFDSFFQVRNWTLLKIVNGQDIHVLEVGPASFQSPGVELPLETGRLNVYRKLPLD
jgi:hypothetical protein